MTALLTQSDQDALSRAIDHQLACGGEDFRPGVRQQLVVDLEALDDDRRKHAMVCALSRGEPALSDQEVST